MKKGLPVNLALAAGVSVVFVALLEGVARILARPQPPPREVAEYIWDWDDMMPGGFYVMRSSAVGWPPWEEFNAEGLRDRTRSHEKPEGTWRVAVLGDSVTLGAGVQPLEAYPRVLEERLRRAGRRVEVMSVALWGWSTRQERIAWHRIARGYQPDEAILAVCLNDIPELHNNLARPPRWLTWLYERSALVRLVVGAESREIEDVERLFKSPDSARVREAMARFFDEVRTLRREVESDGARFAVVVFPFRFQLETGAPAPVVQERIGEFCRTEGMQCLDFLPILKRMGKDAFLDYDHLSVAGAGLTADTLEASDLMPGGYSSVGDLSAYLAQRGGAGAAQVEEWLSERAHTPGSAGIGVLGEALGAESADVRVAAAWALQALGPAAGSEVGRLVAALRTDGSNGARAAAAGALAAIASRGGSGERGANDQDSEEDLSAAHPSTAAPGARDERVRADVVLALFEALGDRSEAVRHAAADALFATGTLSGDLPALVGALGSDDAYVRGFAAWSLGNLGEASAPAVPALVSVLDRPDTEATVIAALARVGPAAAPAVPRLVERLRSDEVDRRWRAARTLGRIGEGARPATDDLIAALDDADAGVRRHAARALGRVASTDGPAPAALQRATGDANAEVRNEARRALERLAGKPPAAKRPDR